MTTDNGQRTTDNDGCSVSSFQFPFSIWRALLALMLALCVLGVAQAGQKKRKARPPADLPGHINYLARQLYGVPLDESDAITGEIQKLVLDHLQQWMSSRIPSDVEVRRELEAAFAQLHYPLFGQPAVFEAPWKGGLLIGAGYTLGWTDYDRVNVIALFEAQEGKCRLIGETDFVPRTDLHYEILPPLKWDDFRFFAYGNRLGKSQLRLTAVLYALQGDKLKSLWEIHDVYDGKMEINKDKVTIRYLKEEEYVHEQAHGRKPPRHEATYLLSPQGMQIQSDREIPF
jgi:hypothetical protein